MVLVQLSGEAEDNAVDGDACTSGEARTGYDLGLDDVRAAVAYEEQFRSLAS